MVSGIVGQDTLGAIDFDIIDQSRYKFVQDFIVLLSTLDQIAPAVHGQVPPFCSSRILRQGMGNPSLLRIVFLMGGQFGFNSFEVTTPRQGVNSYL